MAVWLHVSMCILCMPRKQKSVWHPLVTKGTHNFELLGRGHWQLNSGSLGEQPVHLTIKPISCSKYCTNLKCLLKVMSFYFLQILLFNCVCVCVYKCEYKCLPSPQKDIESPGFKDTGSYELHNVSA